MKLPETQNAHYVHAFKKGYRLALEGKPLTNMPSTFRYDRTLREYYEQGWSQATEEIEAGYQDSLNPPWRNRVAWFVVIIIGSIVTAVGLINGIKQEQKEQQALIMGNQTQQPIQQPTEKRISNAAELSEPQAKQTPIIADVTPFVEPRATVFEATNNPIDTDSLAETLSLIETKNPESNAVKIENTQEMVEPTTPIVKQVRETTFNELSLLTNEQRKDLVLNKQEIERPQYESVKPQKLIDSDIVVENAEFTSGIKNKQAADALGSKIPKQIRTLYFFNQIKGAENQTIYHRWIYKNQEMALIPLKINSNLYRTWSSKRMTSAWQGQWTVEILDQDQNVIYRQVFQYGNG